MKKRSKLENWALIAQIATAIFLLGTAILAGFVYFQGKADYEARTRPYLALNDVSFKEEAESVILKLEVVNFGPVPITHVEIYQISAGTISGDPWKSIGYIWLESTGDIMIFPQRPLVRSMKIAKDDYESRVLPAEKIKFRIKYAIGNDTYWYEAIAEKHDANQWIISSERGS